MDSLYLLIALAISPKILYRMIAHRRYRDGWRQRLGHVARRFPDKKCIWIHAVSVGEVNATKTIITELRSALPEYEIILSATTDTGMARAKSLYGNELYVFYYPLDLSWIVRRTLQSLRPDLCVLMELELWPNLAQEAFRRNIPIVIANGRISDRSFPRYKLLRGTIRRMFSRIRLVLAQSQEYADRFIHLGCRPNQVLVTNSLKYDTAVVADSVPGSEAMKTELQIESEPIWVAGGTGDGEEEIVLGVFSRLKSDQRFVSLRLMLIPRKPERFNEVAAAIEQAGIGYERYSRIKSGQVRLTDKPPVILGDTMGDLRKFYCMSSGPVFVGRTLVPMGGSDMMEPAALGKCVLFGRHTFNFKQTVDALLASQGAIEVRTEEELYSAMKQCLSDPDYARQIAIRGRGVITHNQGATQKTVEAIRQVLNA